MVAVNQKTASAIPLGRRISEIMAERGDAFTIRAFAQRIGMNRESLRRSLAGERPFLVGELDSISNGLGLTIDRLKQHDTFNKEKDLIAILDGKVRNKVIMERANKLASDLADMAIGASERCYSLNNLGRVLFLQRSFEPAHETWLKALTYAQELLNIYNDSRLYHSVTANLMLTYVARKDYSNIEDILSTVEQLFPNDPKALGAVFYARMKVQKDRANYESARKFAYRSLEHYEQTNNSNDIGKALVNLAYIEYLNGEFKTSARASAQAIKFLQENEGILVVAILNYVKTLMKLKEHDAAIALLDKYSHLLSGYPQFYSKFQVFYTILKDDPSYAIRVSENSNNSLEIRAYACKCLFEYYVNVMTQTQHCVTINWSACILARIGTSMTRRIYNMKKVVLGLLLVAVAGYTLTSATVTKNANLVEPEPFGISVIKK